MKLLIRNSDTVFYFLVVLAMVMWGGSWASAKAVSKYSEPELLVLIRFTITFLSFIPLVVFTKTKLKTDMKSLAVLAFCGFLMSFYNQMFFYGVRRGFAGLGGVLVTSLSPVITFFLTSVIYKRKAGIAEILGLFSGLTGSLILIRIWEINFNLLAKSGNLFFIIAAFLWSILTLVNVKVLAGMAFFSYSFYLYFFTSIFNCVFALVKYQHFNIILKDALILLTGDAKFIANILFIALFSTTFATSMYFTASRRIGGNRASSFLFIVPGTALLFTWIFIGEKIELSTLLGGVFSVLAVYTINYKKN